MRRRFNLLAAGLLWVATSRSVANADGLASKGRAPDPTQKTIAELRDADRRLIPLDVMVQAKTTYKHGQPVVMTVVVTNLFNKPLLMNSRMLVNHPKLEGELNFYIVGPNGKSCDIQKPVTPMSIHDDDFVVLNRGQSMQRSVNITDFYELHEKGAYKLRAVYRNDVDKPMGAELRAWKGAVPSETVEFNIQ